MNETVVDKVILLISNDTCYPLFDLVGEEMISAKRLAKRSNVLKLIYDMEHTDKTIKMYVKEQNKLHKEIRLGEKSLYRLRKKHKKSKT